MNATQIMQWRTLKGERIADVLAFVRENAQEGQSVHVGTDSLQLTRVTRFVTVVAILAAAAGACNAFEWTSDGTLDELAEGLDLYVRARDAIRGEVTA